MRSVVVACGVLVAGCQTASTTDETQAVQCNQNVCPPTPSLVVPTDVPTIQAAIDQIGDGGTIQILRGTYTERLAIAGKTVHLVGGEDVTLRSPDPQSALVTYSHGGGGSLEHLALRPRGDGIVAIADGQFPPIDLAVSHVTIVKGEAAIRGSFGVLALDRVHVTKAGGIAITGFSLLVMKYSKFIDLSDPVVIDNATSAATCAATIDHADVRHGAGGGLVIVGHACPVTVSGSTFDSNAIFAIALADTGKVDITDSSASFSRPAPDGSFGDGIVVINSGPVSIMRSVMSNNARAGLSAFGSTASADPIVVQDNTLACNGLPIDAEELSGLSPAFDDRGGNDCSGCGTTVCQILSAGLAPPSLPP